MISQVLKTSVMSIGIGFLLYLLQHLLVTQYLNTFLSANLITILIALLAINSATLGIVLTKVRDLVEAHGNGHCFESTKQQMILSIKEQVSLIATSMVLLIFQNNKLTDLNESLIMFIEVAVISVFAYALIVLYDTAKSVLIIIDFDFKNEEG